MDELQQSSARRQHLARVGKEEALSSMDFAAQLMVARKHLAALLDSALTSEGINTGEADVLMALRVANEGNDIYPSDLVRKLSLTSAGMTKRLNVLESKGLIERRPIQGDRRRVIVKLTNTGKWLADKTISIKATALTGVTDSAFSSEEMAQLNDLMNRFIASINVAMQND